MVKGQGADVELINIFEFSLPSPECTTKQNISRDFHSINVVLLGHCENTSLVGRVNRKLQEERRPTEDSLSWQKMEQQQALPRKKDYIHENGGHLHNQFQKYMQKS